MDIKLQLPKFVTQIMDKFSKAGYEIYIVGGAVRDLLSGRIVDDWDLTTDATPEEMLKLYPDAFYDNVFGTVGIADPSSPNPYEITTFRKEYGYSDSRRPDKVEWGKTLEDDLSRRDFTINAMAIKRLKDDSYELIDKYEGQKDLKNKLIKAVGNPDLRFSEDALRMMRAIRIAAEQGFTIEEKTLEAIKKNAALINKIAKERVKEELFKLIGSPHACDGVLIFKNSGLMAEILPEMEKTFGVEQKSPGRHHIYDVGNHLLMSLKSCKSENPLVKFATLIHDIGKPQTYRKAENGVINFYNHEMVSAKIAENIAERLKFSNEEKEKLIILVRWHQFTVDERQTDSAVRRFIRNVGKENLNDMLDLRTGDRLGGGATETSWRLEEFKKRLIEVQKEPFSLKDIKINGKDVMDILNLKPGRKVGEILNIIFKEVVDKKIENNKEDLIKRLREFKI